MDGVGRGWGREEGVTTSRISDLTAVVFTSVNLPVVAVSLLLRPPGVPRVEDRSLRVLRQVFPREGRYLELPEAQGLLSRPLGTGTQEDGVNEEDPSLPFSLYFCPCQLLRRDVGLSVGSRLG